MPQGRNLTDGELSLCIYVFKSSVNPRNIQVVKRPKTMHFGGFTPYGRINMDGNSYKEDYIGKDLFNPPDLHDAHHFLHELAHSWQHFVGMGMLHLFRLAQKEGREVLKAHGMPKKPHGMSMKQWADEKFDAVYAYDITSGADLMDFTMEQQCEIIADYFALVLWGSLVKLFPNFLNKAWGYPTPTKSQLEAVLQNFLDDRSYPRDLKRMNEARAKWRMVER